MVKLRLQRVGRKRTPVYRIVAANDLAPRSGKFNDRVGLYNPINKNFDLKEQNLQKWLKNGAKPTDAVIKLLQKHKNMFKCCDFSNKPLSVPKQISKSIVSMIQKHISSRLEIFNDVTINVSKMISENIEFANFMKNVEKKHKQPVTTLKKLIKQVENKSESCIKLPENINLTKLYTLNEIIDLKIFTEPQIQIVKEILIKDNCFDMTGVLKQLKFILTDVQYKNYMSKNKYLKHAKLPEKKHILLGQFLYNNNVSRLYFDISKSTE